MKKHINLVLIFVAVAAVVVAAVEFKRLHAATKTNNDAAVAVLKRNEAMKAQLANLKLAFPQPADTGANASAKISAKDKANLKKRQERDARWKTENDASQKWMVERAKNDPDTALKRAAYSRAHLEITLAPFRRMQNLSKEQSEALTEARFQLMLRSDDAMTALQLKQLDVEDVKAMGKEAADEFASSAKAALGDDLYERFLVFENQFPAWDFVNTYGGEMSRVDMPLSVEQASQLADAIANACPAFREGKAMDYYDDYDMHTVDWNAVDAAAVNFLTSEQMNYLKNVTVGYGSSRQKQELDNALQNLAQ